MIKHFLTFLSIVALASCSTFHKNKKKEKEILTQQKEVEEKSLSKKLKDQKSILADIKKDKKKIAKSVNDKKKSEQKIRDLIVKLFEEAEARRKKEEAL